MGRRPMHFGAYGVVTVKHWTGSPPSGTAIPPQSCCYYFLNFRLLQPLFGARPGGARTGLGRPFFIKIITKTFHLWCEKCQNCQKPWPRATRPWRCRSSRCRHGRTSAPSAREPTRHRSRSSRRSLDEGGACWSIFVRAALHLVGGVARPSAHSSSTACMPNASARSTLMLARPSEQSASKRTTCGSAAP